MCERRKLMFDGNTTIIKFSTQKSFVDINASSFAFRDDSGSLHSKVQFQFRQYNSAQQSGNKISNAIDIYMSIDEFAYLCKTLQNGTITRKYEEFKKKTCRMLKAQLQQNGITPNDYNYVEELKRLWNGYCSERDNSVELYRKQGGNASGTISRTFTIKTGSNPDKYPIILCANQCPGERQGTGIIVPRPKKGQNLFINIPISLEDLERLGVTGMRAVNYYDNWRMNGVLDRKIERLRNAYKETAARQGGGQQERQSSYNNRPNAGWDDYRVAYN